MKNKNTTFFSIVFFLSVIFFIFIQIFISKYHIKLKSNTEIGKEIMRKNIQTFLDEEISNGKNNNESNFINNNNQTNETDTDYLEKNNENKNLNKVQESNIEEPDIQSQNISETLQKNESVNKWFDDEYAAWPGDKPISDKWLKELRYFRKQEVNDLMDIECQLAKGFTLMIDRTMPVHEAFAMTFLEVLFSVLEVPDIVTLYKTMMLERHIIFLSQSVDLASMAVLAAKSLLYPFAGGYCQTTVPILPAWASQFLSSPVPYLVGVNEIPADLDLDEVLIVNLDEGKLQGNICKIDLPRERSLINRVNTVLKDNRELITKPPPQVSQLFSKPAPNPKYIPFIKAITKHNMPTSFHKSNPYNYVFPPKITMRLLHLFNKHIARRLEEMIMPCFVTEMTDIHHPVTIFNPDVLRALYNPAEADFYEQFIATSLFQFHCDDKIDEIEQKKAHMARTRRISLAEIAMSRTMPDLLAGMQPVEPPENQADQ